MNNIIQEIDGLMEQTHRVKKAVESACLVCNISKTQFDKRSRLRQFIDARRMVYSFCREDLRMSWVSVGRSFGVNHATVMHHLKVHKQLIEYDAFYQRKYDAFLDLVKADIGFLDIESIIKEVRLLKQRQIEKQLVTNESQDNNS